LTVAKISEDLVLASEPGKVSARAQVTLEEPLEKLKPALHKVVHLLKGAPSARQADRPRPRLAEDTRDVHGKR
jgi:hypothetical protein